MKNDQERAFAYNLATHIADDELQCVAGGSGMRMTTNPTTRVTGDSARGPDGTVDVTFD